LLLKLLYDDSFAVACAYAALIGNNPTTLEAHSDIHSTTNN